MVTYVCDDKKLYVDHVQRETGDRLVIEGIEYQILRFIWVGSYDYLATLAPVSRLTQYIN